MTSKQILCLEDVPRWNRSKVRQWAVMLSKIYLRRRKGAGLVPGSAASVNVIEVYEPKAHNLAEVSPMKQATSKIKCRCCSNKKKLTDNQENSNR